MLKIFLTLLVVLISVYWVGEKARNNPSIDLFLSSIEGHYSSLNERLKDATVVMGLRFLRRLYGWASIFFFICLFAMQYFLQPDPINLLPLFWAFALTFMGWFSIKWVIDHKSTVSEVSKNNVLIIFGPLLMGVFDICFNTKFTEAVVIPLKQAALALHLPVTGMSNPLAIGGALSLIFLAFFCIYYLLTWVVTVPMFIVSVFAVVLPIKFAHLLAKIDRSNTFFWFTVFAMVVISVWLTQL